MRFWKFIKRKLSQAVGTASANVSTLYTNLHVNKYPPAATELYGRVVPIHIKHTVVTSDTVDGTVTMGIHPKGWMFAGGFVGTDGLSASAGVGQTPVLGDGTTANKYMLASDFDATGGISIINGASLGYIPTTDKTITLTFGATGDPTAGKIVEGTLFFIPGS